ncbi:hypothetical protein N657DRAFT_372546 [Parathielavia appendiculata]|uniref:Uncharacterized protein n=1 Tax=Parathielavia appendiculata TaxID=2587402 RepID=A0AAN6YYP8_9PEZI|nr:hypothetical protein N657DRAFT_372546 [Parathielavia appendiculata]
MHSLASPAAAAHPSASHPHLTTPVWILHHCHRLTPHHHPTGPQPKSLSFSSLTLFSPEHSCPSRSCSSHVRKAANLKPEGAWWPGTFLPMPSDLRPLIQLR